MSEYVAHVVGYDDDGKRVNRKYKTHKAADNMVRSMPVSSMRILRPISREALMAALKESPEAWNDNA